MKIPGNISFLMDSFLACVALVASDSGYGSTSKKGENYVKNSSKTKLGTSKVLAIGAAAVSIMAAGSAASADMVTINLNNAFAGTVINGTGTSVSGVQSTPWLTAVFQDVTGGVKLTLTAPGLDPDTDPGPGVNAQHVGKATVAPNGTINAGQGTAANTLGWFFNVTDSKVGSLTFTEQSMIDAPGNAFAAPVLVQDENFFNTTGGAPGEGLASGLYDLNIQFAEGGGPGEPAEFITGDSITFLITGDGITADDFNPTISGGTYGSAAYLDDGDSGWVAGTATTSTYTGTGVPEPASLGLLSVGALGLLVRRRRRALSVLTIFFS